MMIGMQMTESTAVLLDAVVILTSLRYFLEVFHGTTSKIKISTIIHIMISLSKDLFGGKGHIKNGFHIPNLSEYFLIFVLMAL